MYYYYKKYSVFLYYMPSSLAYNLASSFTPSPPASFTLASINSSAVLPGRSPNPTNTSNSATTSSASVLRSSLTIPGKRACRVSSSGLYPSCWWLVKMEVISGRGALCSGAPEGVGHWRRSCSRAAPRRNCNSI